MKKLILFSLFMLIGTVCVFPQGNKKSGLGSFLKKAEKVVSGDKEAESPSGQNILKGYNIEFVSCKGDSATGRVLVEFTLMHELAPQEVAFPAGINSYAIDKKGNKYEGNGQLPKEDGFLPDKNVPTGVLNKRTIVIRGVPPGLDSFALFFQNIVAENKGGGGRQKVGIEFRDVAIDWSNNNE